MNLLLPSKHVQVSESALRQAESLFEALGGGASVAEAWVGCRVLNPTISFARFVILLDVLFALNLLELDNGVLIMRTHGVLIMRTHDVASA
jgi:hypothetical protein